MDPSDSTEKRGRRSRGLLDYPEKVGWARSLSKTLSEDERAPTVPPCEWSKAVGTKNVPTLRTSIRKLCQSDQATSSRV